MAVTASKLIAASSIAALNAAIATEIAATRYPVGQVIATRTKEYPAKYEFAQRIDTGATAMVGYKVLEATSAADLTAQLATQIAAGYLPVGDPISIQVGAPGVYKAHYYQAVSKAS